MGSTARSASSGAPRGQQNITSRRVYVLALIFLAVAALLIGRLFWVQVVIGDELRAQAHEQRSRTYVDRARRGDIVDRDGNKLAYTMQARSLTVSPVQLREELKEQQELQMRIDGLSADDIAAQVDALFDRGPLWGYLIDGHGLYAWGRDMAEARRHLDAFEFLLDCELELRRLTAGH